MKTYKGAILDADGFILFYVGVDAHDRQTAYNRMQDIYQVWVEHTGNPAIKWYMWEGQ